MYISTRLLQIADQLGAALDESMTTDVSTLIDELSDLADDVSTMEDEQEDAEGRPVSWEDWLDRCMENLPRGASVGDEMRLRELLEGYIK